MFHKFSKNTAGRDYVVGDIHGHFTLLQRTLDAIGFNEGKDRLFSVGDLVDRGPESDQVLAWLAKPWFHPVRGNHDDYVVRYKTCDIDNWCYNGGIWFQALFDCEKQEYADQFAMLPHAIEVETNSGTVGIVHADPVVGDWLMMEEFCANKRQADRVMWSRERIESRDTSVVKNVDLVVVGHTPLKGVVQLGNVLHIDTAGWHQSGFFTIADLEVELKGIKSAKSA